MGWPRPRSEIIQAFENQRAALIASCKSYDEGLQWEATRLATTVCTLVHDNRRSVSLLKQLGIKGSLRFVSTENSSARLGKSTWGIVRAVFGQDASGPFSRYEPRLDKNPEDQHRLQFSRWWEQETIINTAHSTLTRKIWYFPFAIRKADLTLTQN
jgi:hypothetical protein